MEIIPNPQNPSEPAQDQQKQPPAEPPKPKPDHIFIKDPNLGYISLEKNSYRKNRKFDNSEFSKNWEEIKQKKYEELAQRISDGADQAEVEKEREIICKKTNLMLQKKKDFELRKLRLELLESSVVVEGWRKAKIGDILVVKGEKKNFGKFLKKENNGFIQVDLGVEGGVIDIEGGKCKKGLKLDIFFLEENEIFEKTIKVDCNMTVENFFEEEIKGKILKEFESESVLAFFEDLQIELVESLPQDNNSEDQEESKKDEETGHKYYFVEEKILKIERSAKLGQIPLFLTKNLEVFMMPIEMLTTKKLFEKELALPSKNLKTSFSSKNSIYLQGLGLLGPYPNPIGPTAIDFEYKKKSVFKGKI